MLASQGHLTRCALGPGTEAFAIHVCLFVSLVDGIHIHVHTPCWMTLPRHCADKWHLKLDVDEGEDEGEGISKGKGIWTKALATALAKNWPNALNFSNLSLFPFVLFSLLPFSPTHPSHPSNHSPSFPIPCFHFSSTSFNLHCPLTHHHSHCTFI